MPWPTAPIGPTGPPGGIAAFGSRSMTGSRPTTITMKAGKSRDVAVVRQARRELPVAKWSGTVVGPKGSCSGQQQAAEKVGTWMAART